tara:strand:- start:11020 stop:12579 length:1560 start_codon:yes stop_codon:yes gene_type:complete
MKTILLGADVFADHRGTVYSYYPDEKLVEYNLMVTRKGDERGYHYHPEFIEYMMVVDGECMYTEWNEHHKEKIHLKTGMSIKIPIGTAHTFTALTDFKFVSMLTKRWHDSDPPIIKIKNRNNMASVTETTICRSCKSQLNKIIFDVGNLKINAFTTHPNTDIGSAPLKLLQCEQCDLIQLSHTVREEDLYTNYWYLSRLNKKIVDNLESIADTLTKECNLQKNDIVVDIGANDGTLLSFYPNIVTKVGIDPAQNIHNDLEKKCDVMIGDFFTLENYNSKIKHKAKAISTIAMFYDLDDPNKFVNDIKNILHKDGIWLCQLMTAKPMIEANDLGNIIHEHLEYYTYKSLKSLMERHKLEIYRVLENDINGGSYQLFIRHFQSGSIDFQENITENDITEWANNIHKNRTDTMQFIRNEVSNGKKIYIMGASTKGNTIMQYYGLDSDTIKGAAEIHPDKIGKYLVGSSIPIVHENDAKKDADYFIVFPFHFKELFVNKIMKDWIDNGGKLIFCTPKFECITK